MEPLGAVEDLVPVEILPGSQLNGGIGTVINADAATLRGTLLVVVDAHTVAAPDDQGGVHAVAAQRVHGSLADGMGGQLGYKGDIHAIVGQGNGHIGFAAAEGEFHAGCLNKALIVKGLQTNHQFTKGYNLCHYFLASLTISTDLRHSSVISSQAPA